jgi:hypothetical protein
MRKAFLQDRRFRSDSFIIRAKVSIRTDGFIVRAGFAKSCTLRVPTAISVWIQTIHTEIAVPCGRSETTGS